MTIAQRTMRAPQAARLPPCAPSSQGVQSCTSIVKSLRRDATIQKNTIIRLQLDALCTAPSAARECAEGNKGVRCISEENYTSAGRKKRDDIIFSTCFPASGSGGEIVCGILRESYLNLALRRHSFARQSFNGHLYFLVYVLGAGL